MYGCYQPEEFRLSLQWQQLMLLVLQVPDSSLRDGSSYINKACTVLKLALIQDLGFAVISPDCSKKSTARPKSQRQLQSPGLQTMWVRKQHLTISFLRGVQYLLPQTPKQTSATNFKQCLKQTDLSH